MVDFTVDDMLDETQEDKAQESEEIQKSDSTPEDFKQVVTWSTDWTVGTIYDLICKGRIDLNPDLQRRDVWNNKKKSNLIESIMLNIPIPQIILAEDKNKPGSYIVIDGKQRLLSISQFMGRDTLQGEPLKLKNLEVLEDLNGKSCNEILDNPEFSGYIDIFETQTIRTIILRNWNEERLLYTIFNRINTGTEKLSAQELRMSLYPGKFIAFVNSNSYFEEMGELLNISEPDKRMRDVELIIRYYAFKYFLSEYSGRLRVFFDVTVEKLNQDFDTRNSDILQEFNRYKDTLKLLHIIFRGNHFRLYKPEESSYSKLFNKTSYDLLMYFVSQNAMFSLLKDNVESQILFKSCYEQLFTDTKIVDEFKSHTTDLEKVKYRFQSFNEIIKEKFGIDVLNYGKKII